MTGDEIGGDKVGGDKVGGDKIQIEQVNYFFGEAPPISPIQLSSQVIDRYIEALQHTILAGFRQDTFVMLTVESLESEDPSTLVALQRAISESLNIQVEAGLAVGGRQQALTSAIDGKRLVALLGGPGLGKTTALRHIALCQIKALLEGEDNHIPVWVSLGKWVEHTMPAEEFIWQEFSSVLDETLVSREEFVSLLRNGRLFILLDGLNELPQRKLPHQHTSSEQQSQDSSLAGQRILDERENSLLVLARENRSKFIISSRVTEYTHLPGWHEYRVLPFNAEQIDEFIQRHLGDQHGVLRTILEAQPQLREIVSNPYLLRSLVFLAKVKWHDIPTDRFELIEQSCLAAIHRETPRLNMQASDVIDGLGLDAYHSMKDGYIGSWFFILFSPDSTEIAAMRCAEGAGLMIRVDHDDDKLAYRYQHQLLQEALALLYVRKEMFKQQSNPGVRALTEIGEIHHNWGKLKEAQENYLRALELCPIAGEEALRGHIYLELSVIYRQLRQPRIALEHASAAVQITGQENSKQLAKAYHELGQIHLRLREARAAERYYKQALAIREQLADQEQYAYELLYGLGYYYRHDKVYNPKRAIELYQKAADIFIKQNNELGLAQAKIMLAGAYFGWGDLDRSLELYKECSRLFEQLRQPLLRADSLRIQGHIFIQKRDFTKANQMYEEARKYAYDQKLLSLLCRIYIWGLGRGNSRQGNYLRAIEYFNEGRGFIKQLADDELLTQFEIWCGVAHFRAAAYAKAASHWKQATQSMDEESRLHLNILGRMALNWAESYNDKDGINWIMQALLNVARWLFIWGESVGPTSWLRRQLWRIGNWMSRF